MPSHEKTSRTTPKSLGRPRSHPASSSTGAAHHKRHSRPKSVQVDQFPTADNLYDNTNHPNGLACHPVNGPNFPDYVSYMSKESGVAIPTTIKPAGPDKLLPSLPGMRGIPDTTITDSQLPHIASVQEDSVCCGVIYGLLDGIGWILRLLHLSPPFPARTS